MESALVPVLVIRNMSAENLGYCTLCHVFEISQSPVTSFDVAIPAAASTLLCWCGQLSHHSCLTSKRKGLGHLDKPCR